MPAKNITITHPKIAKEAYRWIPSTVSKGSEQVKDWQCPLGHVYPAPIFNRTRGKGCPYCSHKKVLKGFNDLQTTHPEIAKLAYGWDPTIVIAGNGQLLSWICDLGHISTLNIRDKKKNPGCSFCSGQKVLIGFNDLATVRPGIASEAYGWDPKTVTRGSKKEKDWQCTLGHIWNTTVHHRGLRGDGCPYCSGHKIWIGYNDLATTHSEISKELVDLDPKTVSAGSAKKTRWKCSNGHIYPAIIANRAKRESSKGTNCPTCAKTGFDPNKKTHLYVLLGKLQNQEIVQFGITNSLITRMRHHRASGFILPPISLTQFKLGSEAKVVESFLLHLMKSHKIPNCSSKGIVFSGSTEAFALNDTTPEFMNSFRSIIRE